jgi:hypothetical protein
LVGGFIHNTRTPSRDLAEIRRRFDLGCGHATAEHRNGENQHQPHRTSRFAQRVCAAPCDLSTEHGMNLVAADRKGDAMNLDRVTNNLLVASP